MGNIRVECILRDSNHPVFDHQLSFVYILQKVLREF